MLLIKPSLMTRGVSSTGRNSDEIIPVRAYLTVHMRSISIHMLVENQIASSSPWSDLAVCNSFSVRSAARNEVRLSLTRRGTDRSSASINMQVAVGTLTTPLPSLFRSYRQLQLASLHPNSHSNPFRNRTASEVCCPDVIPTYQLTARLTPLLSAVP